LDRLKRRRKQFSEANGKRSSNADKQRTGEDITVGVLALFSESTRSRIQCHPNAEAIGGNLTARGAQRPRPEFIRPGPRLGCYRLLPSMRSQYSQLTWASIRPIWSLRSCLRRNSLDASWRPYRALCSARSGFRSPAVSQAVQGVAGRSAGDSAQLRGRSVRGVRQCQHQSDTVRAEADFW
jgi:hypothetical protein